MSKLIVVARVEAKKDKIDLVKAELLKLVKPTRAEQGCIQYDLHQDNDNPAVFIFYEIWESVEMLKAHAQSEHIKANAVATEGAVESRSINKMTLIG